MSYVAREMMFGYRDEFEYFECSNCGCLQILDIPSNLSKYYPENYYSFKSKCSYEDDRNPLTIFADKQRAKYYLGYGSFLGNILSKRRHPLSRYEGSSLHFFDWLRVAKVKLNYKILDVGSGAGNLLLNLHKNSFSSLTGVDPFIENDIAYENGVKIFKRELNQIQEKFDFVMLNHSFEHMPEPLTTLKELWHILKPNRFALIRIPVASSFAWREYQTNWVQLDAPRHLFLHTVESMKMLAEQANFKTKEIIFDSIEYQFSASEKYVRNIPQSCDDESLKLTQEELMSFREKADELNKNNDGDQACFYLYKP